MKYVGSKARYAAELLQLVLRGRVDEPYVEPFVGGANMIERVLGRRIANDVNPYIIAMYRAIQNGWEPPNQISERQFGVMKQFPDRYPPELVGFVGTVCSFGAQWFGTFARGRTPEGDVNYCLQGKRQLLEDRHRLVGIEFHAGDYRDFPIPPDAIIYCDPPYAAVAQPYHARFNSESFWEWVRAKAAEGHRIYVSEYDAPDDFKAIWSKRTMSSQSRGDWTHATERLFVPRGK